MLHHSPHNTVQKLLSFLEPFFVELEQIYKRYAPTVYHLTLIQVKKFLEKAEVPSLTVPWSLFTTAWLTLNCYTYQHTDQELDDVGFSGTLSGGNMVDQLSFVIVDFSMIFRLSSGDAILFNSKLRHGSLPPLGSSPYFQSLLALYSTKVKV